jgi:hypothetical protein
MTTTESIQIVVDGGIISLYCLVDENLKPEENTAWVTFYKDFKQHNQVETWDNSSYILEVFSELKEKEYNKEFKELANTLKVSKKELRKQYITLVKRAKRLGII